MCAARETAAESLLSDVAQEMLRNTTELDYMTHIVFRMYENKRYVSLSSAGGVRNAQKVCKVLMLTHNLSECITAAGTERGLAFSRAWICDVVGSHYFVQSCRSTAALIGSPIKNNCRHDCPELN
jgi:hypothetical protein